MYKGIAGSEGIGIGKVVIIEEHEINIENKKVTDTDNEIKRLQDAIEKFVEITNQMAEKIVRVVGHKNPDTDSICAAIAYTLCDIQESPCGS